MRDDAVGATLRVRVQPRASRNALAGERQGFLVVRLTAPPAEGKANAALVGFLARVLKATPSSIEIVRGASAREKVLRFRGMTAEALRRGLEI